MHFIKNMLFCCHFGGHFDHNEVWEQFILRLSSSPNAPKASSFESNWDCDLNATSIHFSETML